MSGRRCIGFAEREGLCENEAGTPWTPLWCTECDEARRAHLQRQLEELSDRFHNRTRVALGETG